MKRIALLLLLATSLFAASRPVTTVILVRHAEKAGPEGDVPLSDAGVARAKELARVLSGASVDVIYSTQWKRSTDTAAPLAEALGLTPVITPTGKTYPQDLAKRILAENRGQTVVVVGHSNTTMEVLRALGVADPGTIADSQYDDLFVCTIVEGAAPKLMALRYGTVAR